jgi:hypothetical protein
MSPTGGPDAPLKLTPPATRAPKAWTMMWRRIAIENPKLTKRARTYSAGIRRAGVRR